MTYGEALKCGTEYLKKQGIADAPVDAWYLLEFCCGISRAEYLLKSKEVIPAEHRKRYLELVTERGKHIPLQHITGEQEFMGLSFRVSDKVLIPRQDTETLAEAALRHLGPGSRVLDLCTGSGCIAVSIKKFCPGAAVTASDLSEEALDIARENANRLDADVEFVRSDLFEALLDTWDMIVSNPPYIPTRVIDGLAEEVRLHDPRMALDGGEDGLFFYRRIVETGREHLRENGWLLLEIGHDQGKSVSDLMRVHEFADVRVIKDLSGLDRVVAGRRT